MDDISGSVDLYQLLANSPGQPLIWQRFLHELARQLPADAGFLLVTDLTNSENTHFLFSANIHQDYRRLYENKLNRLDVFNHLISKHPYRIFYNQVLNELDRTTATNHLITPPGQHYCFGVSIPCNHQHALSLLISRCSPFTPEEQHHATLLLQAITPALEEAIHTEQRHKIKSQLLHHLGSHFDSYIIVDRQLNIVFSDPLFVSIINQMDCVKIAGNQFGMNNPTIERHLLSMMDSNQGASIHNQCRSCQITLIPIASLKNLYQWECYKEGFILVFTHEKEKNPAVERLMEIYRLSKCEAICALQFMKNPSIAEIAANTFRSQETVRNHIKHVMQKMDAHSQAELMKKLLTLASL